MRPNQLVGSLLLAASVILYFGGQVDYFYGLLIMVLGPFAWSARTPTSRPRDVPARTAALAEGRRSVPAFLSWGR
jgi:hypothetical protein